MSVEPERLVAALASLPKADRLVYATSVDSARLDIGHHDPKAGFPARHGVAPTDVAAARGELAAYYGSILGSRDPRRRR